MDKSVAVRSYIAGLRDIIKDLEVMVQTGDDTGHAHMHGHEVCYGDHGHEEHEHTNGHDHGSHDHGSHGHDSHGHEGHDHGKKVSGHDNGHDHGHGGSCDGNHGHDGHEHGHEHEKKGHDHGHEHQKEPSSGHDHGHGHEEKAHDHGHDHGKKKEDEEVPAWKKRALEEKADPNSAPFGGSWTTEMQVDATKD